MREADYQKSLIKKMKTMFPGCLISKTDSSRSQGIPDLLILYQNTWAALEVKKDAKSSRRPNQEEYVSELDAMSFARFIFPENEEEVLHELRIYFQREAEG